MPALVAAGREARNVRWAGAAMVVAAPLLSVGPFGGLPCPLRALTGVPCPLCGMTGSVKATLAGDVGAAVAANPFGVVAVLAAVVLLVARPSSIRLPSSLAVLAVVLSWAVQLRRFGLV